MPYASASNLRNHPTVLRKSHRAIVQDSLTPGPKDVFLSHSHLDRGALAGVIAVLAEHGATSYVDIADEALPSTPGPATAVVLRQRIVQCPRFVLATSESIRKSRWTPWELGYADGMKGPIKAALFPIVPDNGSVSIEQEYLDTYPKVEIITFQGETTACYAVRDPRTSNQYWRLRDWLKGSPQ